MRFVIVSELGIFTPRDPGLSPQTKVDLYMVSHLHRPLMLQRLTYLMWEGGANEAVIRMLISIGK